MNTFDTIVQLYGKLHSHKYIPFWVLTPFRRILRSIAKFGIPRYLSKIKCPKNNRSDIIVSLTSFPLRINNVWQVIVCMLNQTLQPKKIYLWLSKEQFPEKEMLPYNLRQLEGDVFEIRLVDGDIRSHKKYYYVSIEHPNEYIFLIDDDIYYPRTLLENSWKEHLNNETAVICNYGYHIKYDINNSICRYNTWQHCYERSESKNLFFGSGGGTLFKPALMYKDLTNIDIARKLAPMADDIWLNAMVKKAGLKTILLKNGQILPIHNKENMTLSSVNVGESQNDIQLKAVWNYYNLY